MSKGDKKSVGDVVGLIIKKIAFIHFKPHTSNLKCNQTCSHCKVYRHDVIIVLHYIKIYGKVNHKESMLGKNQGFEKGQKGKGATNKGSSTKPTMCQTNIMEIIFTCLKAIVTSMVLNMAT